MIFFTEIVNYIVMEKNIKISIFFLQLIALLLTSGCIMQRSVLFPVDTAEGKTTILYNKCKNTYSYSVKTNIPEELFRASDSPYEFFSNVEKPILAGKNIMNSHQRGPVKIDRDIVKNLKYTFNIKKEGEEFRTYTNTQLAASSYEDDFIKINNAYYRIITFCGGTDYREDHQ